MMRARIPLIACAVLLVFAAGALAATPAPPTAKAANPADAAFLASLAAPAPEAPVLPALPGLGVPAPSPRSCGPHFCADARQQCTELCAPCTGVVTGCVLSICDFTCWCGC